MYRVCVGYVSRMYRVCIGIFGKVEGMRRSAYEVMRRWDRAPCSQARRKNRSSPLGEIRNLINLMQRLWFYCDESSVNTGWSEGLVREGLLIATLTKSYKSYTSTMILLPPFAFASLRYAMTNHRYAIKAHWILINKSNYRLNSPLKLAGKGEKTTITTIPRGNNTPPRQWRNTRQ